MFGDDHDPIRKPFEVIPQGNGMVQLPGGTTVVGVTGEQAQFLQARARFVESYCSSKGWNPLNLTVPQLLEVRNLPGWKNPI